MNFHQISETALEEKNKLLEQASELEDRLSTLRKEIKKLQKEKATIKKGMTAQKAATPSQSPNEKVNFQDLLHRDIFAALGAYPDVSYVFDFGVNYTKPHLGLINDDDYCQRADKYNLAHPENMLVSKNFFTDYPLGSNLKIF